MFQVNQTRSSVDKICIFFYINMENKKLEIKLAFMFKRQRKKN